MLIGINTGKSIGILNISIKGSYLNSLLENETFETFILDDSDRIIASKSSIYNNKHYSGYFNVSSSSKNLKYNNTNYQAIVKEIILSDKNGPFKIISLIPTYAIQDPIYDVTKISTLIIAICLLFTLIIIIIISFALSVRVKKLSNDMHSVALGNFNYTPSIKGKDEIGCLSHDLNIMVKSINTLVHQVYESKIHKKQLIIKQREIELKMLANQIHQYFKTISLFFTNYKKRKHCYKS